MNTEHFRSNLYKLTLNPRTLKIIQKKREKRLSKRLSTNGFKVTYMGLRVRIKRETGGLDPQPKNHKNIGFLSIAGPDSLKITKLQYLPRQQSILVHERTASGRPLQWRANYGQALLVSGSSLRVVRVELLLTKLSEPTHGLVVRIPVFWVSEHFIPITACSATNTS